MNRESRGVQIALTTSVAYATLSPFLSYDAYRQSQIRQRDSNLDSSELGWVRQRRSYGRGRGRGLVCAYSRASIFTYCTSEQVCSLQQNKQRLVRLGSLGVLSLCGPPVYTLDSTQQPVTLETPPPRAPTLDKRISIVPVDALVLVCVLSCEIVFSLSGREKENSSLRTWDEAS